MANYIINASPAMISLGTDDKSVRPIPISKVNEPLHLPKFYLYTQKGPTTSQLVEGGAGIAMYGLDTFDGAKKYFNHATVFATSALAEGNAIMVERVIPDDAGPESNIVLWLDVLPTTVDMYERNVDGSIVLDANGQPVVTGQTTGYKLKWIAEVGDPAVPFGQKVVRQGTQTDANTGTTSQMYPMFEYKASSIGEFGNNIGFRITPLLKENTPSDLVNATKSFPYAITVVKRAKPTATPEVVKTIFGGNKVNFFLNPEAVDPATGVSLYLGDKFVPSYNNTTDPRYPLVYGEIGDQYIYEENISTLLTELHAAESQHLEAYSDFTDSVEDKYLVNIMTGVYTNGAPYHTLQMVDDSTSVRFTEYTNIFLQGGSDGTMNDTLFAELVSRKVLDYMNPDSPLMDMAINIENIIHDSGFPMETKKVLPAFISNRKDTAVVLSPCVANEDKLEIDVIMSRSLALRTMLQLYPESDYFGTPTMRGVVMGTSGIDRRTNYKGRLPTTLTLLRKSARYMGAVAWKAGRSFDMTPNNIIDDMYDLSPAFIPASTRNRMWDAGIVWAQPYDRRNYFFPAIQTVYPDDSSVLNSFFTVMAIANINRFQFHIWQKYTGVASLSNAQLKERVETDFLNAIKGKFDNRYVIKPTVIITDDDAQRGYSWTLRAQIYAANMKTVMTSYVEAYRIEDLNA